MSYYLFDFNNDIAIDKLVIGKVIKYDETTHRRYIYYIDTTPKEIFIKFPSTRIIYSYKNSKYNQIKLPIYPVWSENKKFISFIKQLERYIKNDIVLEKQFISCLDKKDDITSLKLNVNLDFKVEFSINTTIRDLKINGEIEGIITIPYIWIKDDKYGLSINVYQLKYIPRIEELAISFFDKPSKVEKVDNIEYKKPVIIPEQITVKKQSGFHISANILQEAMSKIKLKKISN